MPFNRGTNEDFDLSSENKKLPAQNEVQRRPTAKLIKSVSELRDLLKSLELKLYVVIPSRPEALTQIPWTSNVNTKFADQMGKQRNESISFEKTHLPSSYYSNCEVLETNPPL